jgi:hypothetical protein
VRVADQTIISREAELIETVVDGSSETHDVVNVLRKVDCVDEVRARIEWSEHDYEKLNGRRYRSLSRLKVREETL